MTEPEAKAERNVRLYACDWTQASDAPVTENERSRWRTYRQELRDITLQPGFPSDITWPEEPEKDLVLDTEVVD